jgi:anthranilate synthase
MAIEDHEAGRWGVQFHPESILTASGGHGQAIIANVLRLCRARIDQTLRQRGIQAPSVTS